MRAEATASLRIFLLFPFDVEQQLLPSWSSCMIAAFLQLHRNTRMTLVTGDKLMHCHTLLPSSHSFMHEYIVDKTTYGLCLQIYQFLFCKTALGFIGMVKIQKLIFIFTIYEQNSLENK